MIQRPIKIRFWEPTHGHFFYATPKAGHLMLWEHDKECTAQPIGLEKHYNLQMFTGLHDKNGKEIWEGDILNIDGAIPSEVYWFNLSWQLRAGEMVGGMLGNWEPEQIEVIGNIYEHPNLLKP